MLSSFSFFPVVDKQVFNPVEKHWILAHKASVIRSSSSEAKTYASLFLGDYKVYGNIA
jgi:hypothetical protein